MTPGGCQRLVVVLGPADPVLESTLTYVGLHVVHTAEEVTVWAPLEWELSWPVSPDVDREPVAGLWDNIPWGAAEDFLDEESEEHHG